MVCSYDMASYRPRSADGVLRVRVGCRVGGACTLMLGDPGRRLSGRFVEDEGGKRGQG